ncbi:hypothetical protein [Sphingobium sp. BS19]|uniref:hypothetical protein n=1 Tax=Sphingobium sp. BS19 TaxID=3018973 RepID=UPI0022EDBEE8|nr:hypothetical protein [Sphingobium sp. BS19]GLI99977.1 hypothetical protein Sbs19_37950 [Sphingobium sp. BS19]
MTIVATSAAWGHARRELAVTPLVMEPRRFRLVAIILFISLFNIPTLSQVAGGSADASDSVLTQKE